MKNKAAFYVALIHYPVINKEGKVIASSLTNLDLHDIARLCRTYGVRRYFVVQPLSHQRRLAEELLEYWQKGYGGVYNPDRQEALKILRVVPALEVALQEITSESQSPILLGTDARPEYATLDYAAARAKIAKGGAYLLLLGTAWGLAPKLLESCHYVLAPIKGRAEDGYNHLSVRSAAAIILDRLLGEAWWKSFKEEEDASGDKRD